MMIVRPITKATNTKLSHNSQINLRSSKTKNPQQSQKIHRTLKTHKKRPSRKRKRNEISMTSKKRNKKYTTI